MKRVTMVAAALGMSAVPAVAYYVERPANDPLAEELHDYGFFPVNPPSTLMEVGSLYYVSADVRDFSAICRVSDAGLQPAVFESPSVEIEEDLKQNGSFETGVTVNLQSLLRGNIGDSYTRTVHFSLTDVRLEEIPLSSNWTILEKLMTKPECGEVAVRLVESGAYVCQGQKILRATAEFKLDRDGESKLNTEANTTQQINEKLKTAITAQSGESVVEKEGRLFAGAALNYGVAMNPTCLAPKNARFQRVLPRTWFGRAVNFVLFQVIEPLWPNKQEPVAVAQDAHAEGR
jgi:hypothetical protein